MNNLELNLMDLSLNELLRTVNKTELILNEQYHEIRKFRDIILQANNRRFDNGNTATIFLAGSGRSGFVAKFFAMRLMHLDYHVYVFGETLVPPVRDGDIIIFISKSGGENAVTDSIESTKLENIKKSEIIEGKDNNKIFEHVKILSVCGSHDCYLANHSDAKIVIEALRDRKEDEEECERFKSLGFNHDELVIMGTGFEDSALIILDALIIEIMNNLGLCEADLADNHENINRPNEDV